MRDLAALNKRDQRLSVIGVQPWYARVRVQGAASSLSLEAALSANLAAHENELEHTSQSLPQQDLSAREALRSVSGVDLGTNKLSDVSSELQNDRAVVQAASIADESTQNSQPTEKQFSPYQGSTETRKESPKSAVAIMDSLAERQSDILPKEVVLHAYACKHVLLLSESDHGMSRSDERAFMGNLMVALLGQDAELHPLGEFEWPVFRWPSQQAGVSSEEVLEMIQRFIVEQGDFDEAIFFGSGFKHEALEQLNLANGSSLVCVTDNTPAQCVRSAGAKLRLWKILLPIRSRFIQTQC